MSQYDPAILVGCRAPFALGHEALFVGALVALAVFDPSSLAIGHACGVGLAIIGVVHGTTTNLHADVMTGMVPPIRESTEASLDPSPTPLEPHGICPV